MIISFETMPYELEHGRSPRGKRSWAFCPFHLRNDPWNTSIIESPEMGFSAAKKWATDEIKSHRNSRRAGDLPMYPWNTELWAVMP